MKAEGMETEWDRFPKSASLDFLVRNRCAKVDALVARARTPKIRDGDAIPILVAAAQPRQRKPEFKVSRLKSD